MERNEPCGTVGNIMLLREKSELNEVWSQVACPLNPCKGSLKLYL